MAALNVRSAHVQPSRHDAIADARDMQASVAQECSQSGREPPPYRLLELIGKGSFGRVYKAQAEVGASDATPVSAPELVAIKIINIETGDASDPGANTFGDVLQEVETLKLLRNAGARNVNLVVDALLVGHAIWMVTEYCAGGSVSTLMKAVGRLHERWIVPLLREVAAGIFWIHKHGILHRDIKSANVLVTEQGAVQLCDFGVAAVVQTSLDKRSTITGSLHWMAPELFDPGATYGTEVDIWAFGSMAYEVATGLPPNASFRDIPRFGAHLRSCCPRLEGDEYAPGLKDFVACCMVDDPAQRPPIEQLQQHPYIVNTEDAFPASSLSELVHTYKLWEAQGGSRASLFSAAGAQREAAAVVADASALVPDEWNFSTLDDAALATLTTSLRSMPDAHDTAATLQSKRRTRRRMPPPPIARPPTAPLERLFDPNTLSSYRDNARTFYAPPWEVMAHELPLRASSETQSIRESLIDLDAALGDDRFTVQPPTGPRLSGDAVDASRRRTMDWSFPADAPTSGYLTLDHDAGGFASSDDERTLVQSQRGLVAQAPPNFSTPDHRASILSLIDLDASMPSDDEQHHVSRPSTTGSDTQSDASYTPFGLETHAFESATQLSGAPWPPPVYFDVGRPTTGAASDLAVSRGELDGPATLAGYAVSPRYDQPFSEAHLADLPALPQPPATAVMLGTASRDAVKAELLRFISSFQGELTLARDALEKLPTTGDALI